jgi:hypothetical protein
MIEWHEILATLLQSQGRLSEAAGAALAQQTLEKRSPKSSGT